MSEQVIEHAVNVNAAGLSRNDYRGAASTLCQGCGHNSIASQIVAACYELNIIPEKLMKFSGIGCSSKSPTYFMLRSFAFNGLHGRMPSLAIGASFADLSLKVFAVSGDGDTASIGMGQFKHAVRRNIPMVYIVENNGVYGLTKGQFSATVEQGMFLKRQGVSKYLPVDICMEALAAHASFVARSFAGDPKQVKDLIKAALSHRGIAVLDIISPCVTFNNKEDTIHSYAFGKDNEEQLHGMTFVPARDEIMIEDYEEGEVKAVKLHDESTILLKKLERDYDPTNRAEAFRVLDEGYRKRQLVTGLLYIDPEEPVLHDKFNLVEGPLNRLQEPDLRPKSGTLDKINASMR